MNVRYCVLFSSRVRVRIRYSVWLASDHAHVFLLLPVVTVTHFRLYQTRIISRFIRCKYYQSTEPTLDGIKCEIYYLVSVYTKCVNITETGRKTGVRCGSASKYSLGTAEEDCCGVTAR